MSSAPGSSLGPANNLMLFNPYIFFPHSNLHLCNWTVSTYNGLAYLAPNIHRL